MRLSKTLNLTTREVPAEAEITSHKLMLRAGLMRKTASGIYNFMPLGLKALKNIEKIVREEMDEAGSSEILASAIIPSEFWQESGRWDKMGPEMFRLKDRNDRDFCLGPTHEEVFTDLVRREIKSYKQLPLSLYQIQTKYRDERRPRFGLMRSREFIMKDAYSFDRDLEGMDNSYKAMRESYTKIFKRCNLDAKPVLADTGAIGGSDSAEFMIKSEVGEDDIVFCTSCDYAANIEKAKAKPEKAEKEEMLPMEKVETISIKTIDEVSKFFGVKKEKIAKTLIYKCDDKVIGVILRGDREVNEVKIANAIGGASEVEMADTATVYKATGAKSGFTGPIGLKITTLLVDEEVVSMCNFIVGANETDFHFKNANYGRDFKGVVGDFRNVSQGEECPNCGEKVIISRGIELGHIFKLGTKYSDSMKATFVDEDGKNKLFQMGCYGIGINRTLAAIIEEHNDENGIVWPYEVAPYKVVVIPAVFKDETQRSKATELYKKIKNLGIDVVLDDRNERAGVKFKDADLIGYPIRVTIGKKINDGEVEFKLRTSTEVETIKYEDIVDKILQFNK